MIGLAKTVGVDDIKGTKKDIVKSILKAKAEENTTSQTLKRKRSSSVEGNDPENQSHLKRGKL